MHRSPVVIWIIGPAGCGKSHLISQLLNITVINQDIEFEQLMAANGLPLDLRRQSDTTMVENLRSRAADLTWARVPVCRAIGASMAIETTGDKPDLLLAEVQAGAKAGFENFGVAIRQPLDVCLERNRSRSRILPESVVSKTWRDFESSLAAGVYQKILGADRFKCMPGPVAADIQAWVSSFSA